MKYLTQRKLALIIIAVSLLFLFQPNSTLETDPVESEKDNSANSVEHETLTEPRLNERVIYSCRMKDEEIPAVQISEITDEDGQVMSTVGRAAHGTDIEVEAAGESPNWDYKSVSARAGDNIIEVAFAPAGGRQDYDWVLTLANENTYLKERVRDCTEVSDE